MPKYRRYNWKISSRLSFRVYLKLFPWQRKVYNVLLNADSYLGYYKPRTQPPSRSAWEEKTLSGLRKTLYLQPTSKALANYWSPVLKLNLGSNKSQGLLPAQLLFLNSFSLKASWRLKHKWNSTKSKQHIRFDGTLTRTKEGTTGSLITRDSGKDIQK